jgi:hypothetical protein
VVVDVRQIQAGCVFEEPGTQCTLNGDGQMFMELVINDIRNILARRQLLCCLLWGQSSSILSSLEGDCVWYNFHPHIYALIKYCSDCFSI